MFNLPIIFLFACVLLYYNIMKRLFDIMLINICLHTILAAKNNNASYEIVLVKNGNILLI